MRLGLGRVEDVKEEREVDGAGQMYLTIAELQAQDAARRAGVLHMPLAHVQAELITPSIVQNSNVLLCWMCRTVRCIEANSVRVPLLLGGERASSGTFCLELLLS